MQHKQSAKRSRHRLKFLVAVAAEDRFKRWFPVERPVAVSVKKTIAVAPAALGFHPGSSVFRRQPAPCIRPSLRSDVDLLCPLSTLSLATGQAFTIADPDHASSFSLPQNCSKKPPPRLINQSRSRPDRRHASFRPTPRRRIRENPVMYSSPLRVYRSFHCAPCG